MLGVGCGEMIEREQAMLIANNILEFIPYPATVYVIGDPDCDACVLARQFLRECERSGPSRNESGT